MRSIRNVIRAAIFGIAIIAAGAMPAKKAHADGGAVVAGIAGGLLLGTIIGSTSQNTYHSGGAYYHGGYHQPYYYQPYYAPRYYVAPRVRHYRHRGFKHRHYRRGHGAHHRRHHRRGHRYHRRH